MAIHWSNWKALGRPNAASIGRPFVQQNQDGRLEVFVTDGAGVFDIWQVSPNAGWSTEWASQGSPAPDVRVRSHVVGTNADGRQEIFAIGDNGAIWHKWQVFPNAGWSQWATMGMPAGFVVS